VHVNVYVYEKSLPLAIVVVYVYVDVDGFLKFMFLTESQGELQVSSGSTCFGCKASAYKKTC
jgi:hypothetical protein